MIMLPAMLQYQNVTGITLFPFFSEAIHWIKNLVENIALPRNPIFSTRFLIQWIASEKKGKSVIPVTFWYWSIAVSIIMCAYWIMERSPVGILAYLPNSFVYMRNLHLIRKHQLAATASAPTQVPHKES